MRRDPLALIVEPADPTDARMAEALQKARDRWNSRGLAEPAPRNDRLERGRRRQASTREGSTSFHARRAQAPEHFEVRRCQAVRTGHSSFIHRVSTSTRDLGDPQRQERAARPQGRGGDPDQHDRRPVLERANHGHSRCTQGQRNHHDRGNHLLEISGSRRQTPERRNSRRIPSSCSFSRPTGSVRRLPGR